MGADSHHTQPPYAYSWSRPSLEAELCLQRSVTRWRRRTLAFVGEFQLFTVTPVDAERFSVSQNFHFSE